MMISLRSLIVAIVLALGLTGGAQAQTLYYIHADQLNTPRLIADEAGTTVWRWDNREPFGTNAPSEYPGANGQPVRFNLRFPGQYYDSETGTFYNYFRDYDPQTGRYIQSDPIGLEGGSMSLYTYVDNAPTMKIDPLGLSSDDPLGGGSAKPPVGIPNPSAQAQQQLARQLTQMLKQLAQKMCPDDQPCDPPVGTQCYEGPDYGKPHAGLSPHYHVYEMQKKSDGTCFWRYRGGKVGVGVFGTTPAGMSPCSSYPNFTGRGS